jgi:hypothetical protein
MARIEMSPAMYTGGIGSNTGIAYRMMGIAANATNTIGNSAIAPLFHQAFSPASNYTMATFMIMQGSIPADVNNIATNIPTSNVLLTWSSTPYASNSYFANQNEIVTMNLPFVAASSSGTASWFYLKTHPYSGTAISATQNHGIIGTVGVIGSGADLEIAATNIVSGNQYRIVNFKMAFPYYLDY